MQDPRIVTMVQAFWAQHGRPRPTPENPTPGYPDLRFLHRMPQRNQALRFTPELYLPATGEVIQDLHAFLVTASPEDLGHLRAVGESLSFLADVAAWAHTSGYAPPRN